MFAPARPTQVPWKCDHCGAKYLVTLASMYDSNHQSPPCKVCGKSMHWKSERTPAAIEPLFELNGNSQPQ
ncbi:MAG: hypothetical protein AB7G28_03560 [Pirellulales bacterium]